MSPEERAERFVARFVKPNPDLNGHRMVLCDIEPMEEDLADLIREAEAFTLSGLRAELGDLADKLMAARNEALEEAAGICEQAETITGHEFKVNGKPLAASDGCTDFMSAKQVNAIVMTRASAIRNLKTKD